MRTSVVIGCLVVALIAAGCGGGMATPSTAKTTSTTTARDPASQLDSAVRRALRANYVLSGYVLWHNAIPVNAQDSTRGPALAGLRSSAAQRNKSGIRIKPVSGRLTIVSVSIDPSFTRATAVTLAAGHLRPYEGGKAEPRTIAVHERARVQLRRLAGSKKFVVWQVTVLK
jgi:hypothetical protein